jgi:pyruvate/2-oxoglutarate dehydrogenase complex dihydrolipoamide dehydrogenase (E3) component
MNLEKVDVLVIGAGPAGTVAASIVNKAGYKVKIVEKLKFLALSLAKACFKMKERLMKPDSWKPSR